MVENAAKMGKNGTFLFFGWGTAGVGMRRDELCWDCSRIAELQTYIGFLKIPWQAKYCGPLSRHAGSDPIKVGILGVFPQK